MKNSDTKPCSVCKKPVTWKGNSLRPFCSERCRTIDLGNWASEKYRVPVSQATAEQGESYGEQTGIPEKEENK